MKLYHGTSAKYLPSIREKGLVPRKRRKGNWTGTIESNPRAVYLTNAYPLYFANAAHKDHNALLILEVDIDNLNCNKLAPDEDFLEQASRHLDIVPSKIKDMVARTRWFRKRALTEFQHEWQKSVDNLGTCCYYGNIPFSCVTRYALIDPRAPIQRLSDPTITILNYRIMGGYYRNLVSKIFNDPLTDDVYTPLQLFETVPTTGIQVTEV